MAPSMAAKHHVSRQSVVPVLLALLYLLFLLVPWALTYKIAKDPAFLIRKTDTSFFEYNYAFYRLWSFRLDYSLLAAIPILDAIQVILCFPVLSALLQRAAVVYSQRNKAHQKHNLTIRQLFALADQGWYNVLLVFQRSAISELLVFGWLLLAVAFVLPLVRSGLVTYDAVSLELVGLKYWVGQQYIGTSPGPGTLRSVDGSDVVAYARSKLHLTTGGHESQLWPTCNDANTTHYWERSCGFNYNPYIVNQSSLSNFWEAVTVDSDYSGVSYSTNGSALMFAASLQAGSTTGYAPNGYALGLQSGAHCVRSSPSEVSSNCARAAAESGGWNTSIFIPEEVRIDICLPNSQNGSFWGGVNGSSPWKPYNFVEDMYIGIQEEENTDGDIYGDWGLSGTLSTSSDDYYAGELGTGTTLLVHCQLNTNLSYFLLGNDSSNGVPSPFLDELPSDFTVPGGVYNDDTSLYFTPGMGPLMTTAQALFGDNSWFDMIDSIASDSLDNTTELILLRLICQAIPLQQASYFTDVTSLGDTPLGGWCSNGTLSNTVESRSAAANFANLVRHFFYIFDIPRLGRAALNTGAFFANDNLLSSALPYDVDIEANHTNPHNNHLYHYDSYKTEPRIPIATTPVFVAVTVLIAIQVLGILALLAIIYSTPVWTHTLDALALAGLGAQLAERDVFRSPGTWDGPLRPSEADSVSRAKLFRMDGLIDLTSSSSNSTVRVCGGSGENNHQVELGNLPPPYAASGEEPGRRSASREGAAAERTASRDSIPPYPPTSENTQAAGRESRFVEENQAQ